MRILDEKSMSIQEPINESGASVAMNELSLLLTELNEVVNRCANRISPILRGDIPDDDKLATRRGPESDLFNNIYCYANDCRIMIAQLHSILDRVDL